MLGNLRALTKSRDGVQTRATLSGYFFWPTYFTGACAVRDGTDSPAAGGLFEDLPVCLPRYGNGTGRQETIYLTGRDGSARFLGGTGRDRIEERVGKSVGMQS